jgi:CRP-like cAMP-binding protein
MHGVDKQGERRAVEAREDLRGSLAGVGLKASPESIEALVRLARFRSVAPGERVYGQGDPVLLTLILNGNAISQRTTEDGRLFMFAIGGAGLLFGYSAVSGVASSVEILALTACEVAQWSGPDVRPLFERDPGLAMTALDSHSASLHLAMEEIERFLHQDARGRVVRILDRYRNLFFGESPIVTRAHLTGLVGTTREMTGRVLRQLEREGTLARVGRSGLVLLRPERLTGMADRCVT